MLLTGTGDLIVKFRINTRDTCPRRLVRGVVGSPLTWRGLRHGRLWWLMERLINIAGIWWQGQNKLEVAGLVGWCLNATPGGLPADLSILRTLRTTSPDPATISCAKPHEALKFLCCFNQAIATHDTFHAPATALQTLFCFVRATSASTQPRLSQQPDRQCFE